MEYSGITEIELWDYISKKANTDTILKVEAWMDSSDAAEDAFRQLTKIHKLTAGMEVEYDLDAAKERFLLAIKTENQYKTN